LFLVGPLGAHKYDVGKAVAEACGLELVSSRDIILQEVENKTTLGKYFMESVAKGELIRDDSMFKAVQGRLEDLERQNKSYILVGFPRTRVQALALCRMGVMPDKVFFMEDFDEAAF
jgi:adenylate kinase